MRAFPVSPAQGLRFILYWPSRSHHVYNRLDELCRRFGNNPVFLQIHGQNYCQNFMNPRNAKLNGDWIKGCCMAVIIYGIAGGGIQAQTSGSISHRSGTTNSIPENLFLTDDGFVFGYRSSQPGQRFVSIPKIEEAEKSPESRPADRYPQGNWGDAVDGIQVSLRLQSSTFTNGESITPVMLVRNVTNRVVTHYWPSYVVISRNGKALKRKGNGAIEITAWPFTNLLPQTQHKYSETLNPQYDLTENGEYTLQAVCKEPAAKSKSISIVITNTPSKP